MLTKINDLLFKKRGSTHFLRFVIFLMGTGVLALCIFALPSVWKGGSAEFPSASQAVFLIVLGLYATTIPFYVALWQTLKLLRYIDQNKAFSDLSVKDITKYKILCNHHCRFICRRCSPLASYRRGG
jgi:uncharacterized membrane protein